MKIKITTIVLMMTLLSPAESSGQYYDSLDINHLHVPVRSNGDCLFGLNFWDAVTAPNNPIAFSTGALWIGGLDATGQLHVAASTYRQSGSDFWAGPLDTLSVVCTPAQNVGYDHVWKINKTTIDSFRLGLYSSVPASIAQWPGNGNLSAGEARVIAPYVDVNGDQFYNPASGDYPLIRGDQALFFVFNDTLQAQPHTETGGRRFGVEIRGLAYAVNCTQDSALQNTVFVQYEIINRSTMNYDSVYCGIWTDFDLIPGFYQNAVGSDSTGNGYYYFNRSGDAIGITLLDQQMNSFMACNNNFSNYGNPVEASDFYGYLKGTWKDSSQLLYSNSTVPTNMMYTGDPYAETGWLSPTGSPNDFRGIGSYGPFTLAAGQRSHFTIAYTYAHDYTGDSAYETVILRNRMQTVRQYFQNDSSPCNSNITGISTEAPTATALSVYPNPAAGTLHFTGAAGAVRYAVFDINGKQLLSGPCRGDSSTIDISGLSDGVYVLQLTSNKETSTTRFVKVQ